MTNVYGEGSTETRMGFVRVAWGAIFAGVIITVVVQLLLTLLGVGIGAATVEPLQQAQPGKGLGIGAVIWFFITTLIAIFIGARAAGHLSGVVKSDRRLHGILTWGTSAILGMLCLATTAGVLLGGAGSLLGGATAMAGRNPAYANAQPTTGMGGAYADESTTSGRASLDQSAQTDQRNQDLRTEQRARQAGDVAAKRVSQAALWSFFVLLISGLVAAYAGGGSAEAWSRHRYGQSYGGMHEPSKA